MPSGSKKRRAQKKKDEAAARDKSENEARLTASSKEHSPLMQTESNDGVTAVFDVLPTVVLPKTIVLRKNILASEVLDTKRKDTQEGFKENALHPAFSSYLLTKSPDVAEDEEPLESSLTDKISVVGESSAVDAPCVIVLDSEDEDGGSVMSPDAFKEKETEGIIEIPMPTEAYSRVLVLEHNVTSPAKDDVATELSQDDYGRSILASEGAAFSVITDKAALMTEGSDCSNAEAVVFTDGHAAGVQRTLERMDFNAVEKNQDLITPKNRVVVENEEAVVFTDGYAADDQRTLERKEDNDVEKNKDLITPKNKVAVENEEAAAVDEVDSPEKTEETVQADLVEAAVKKQEAAISEVVIDKENEVDAAEKIEEAVKVDEVEAAVKNQEAAISEEKNSLETGVMSEMFETTSNNLEAGAANPAVDIINQIHDAVSTEQMTPEVRKQVKEMKEIIEDVLNRLNALLQRN